jgi:hypothetical protein
MNAVYDFITNPKLTFKTAEEFNPAVISPDALNGLNPMPVMGARLDCYSFGVPGVDASQVMPVAMPRATWDSMSRQWFPSFAALIRPRSSIA